MSGYRIYCNNFPLPRSQQQLHITTIEEEWRCFEEEEETEMDAKVEYIAI